jgi:hypothetical protein
MLRYTYAPLALQPGGLLAVRLGVHTGLVVVDDVGGTHHEPLALGRRPILHCGCPPWLRPRS